MGDDSGVTTMANLPTSRPDWYAAKPTRFTLFLRTFLPYQVWRFLRINLKMFRIIAMSHRGAK